MNTDDTVKFVQELGEKILEVVEERKDLNKKDKIYMKIYDDVESDFEKKFGEINENNESGFYEEVEKRLKQKNLPLNIRECFVLLAEKEISILKSLFEKTGKEVYLSISKKCNLRVGFLKKASAKVHKYFEEYS